LHFTAVDDWSLQDSILHRRDARAKILATLILLLALSRGRLLIPVGLIAAALGLSHLPIVQLLLRASAVLPFTLSFALASLLSGRSDVALNISVRSYLSAICVLMLIGTTPLPSVLYGLRRMGAPPLLLEVIQFVYRYLFLIAGQARRMAMAATARGARRSFPAVAGSVGVLFARSYERAEAIHRAMLARGYAGHLHSTRIGAFTRADAALVAVAALGGVAAFL
jgi:cobalt/nickel transport system permease protein